MSRGILKNPGRKILAPNNSSKAPIEVFCRVRPLKDCESCAEVVSDTVLQLNAPKNLKTLTSRVDQVKCTFNKVFSEDVTQKQIFEHVGYPLIQDLLSGKNGLCFMYGITGSGKTHTMNGEPCDGGVLPRCLDSIFNSIRVLQTERCVFKPDGYNGFEIISEQDAKVEAEKKYSDMESLQKNMAIYDTPRIADITTMDVDEDNNYAIFVSFVEIYNNSVFDLLGDAPLDGFKQPKPPASKILREDQKRNMFVYEVTVLEVKNTEEAFSLFWMGQQRRKTALTMLNAESSRSHCVFTIKLVQAPLGPSGNTIMKDPNLIGVSQLSLCDLAGSERISRTKTDGERVRQAGHINNSLMSLRSCIESLRENQKTDGGNKMVPYRDSKLTHLFKNYFEGDGKVSMIVCLNPRVEDFDESLHVMRFAEMTQEVKISSSEVLKLDHGLTPGRGKKFKLLQVEDNSGDVRSPEIQPLQLFAPFPLLQLSGYSDSTTLINLMLYLEDRLKLRKTLHTDWEQKHMEVRQIILQVEQDNIDLTKAMEEQRVSVSDKEKEAKTFQKRIRTMTEKYEALQKSSHALESQKRQLSVELEKQKDLLNKERQEKLKIKQSLNEFTSNEKTRWEKECDQRVLNKQLEMEQRVNIRDRKLIQVLNVVDNLQIPAENQKRLNQIIAGGKQFKASNNSIDNQSSSGDDNQQPHSKNKKTPSLYPKPNRNGTPQSKSKNNVRSKSPPATPTRRAPIRSKHRRSRSSDFWLNHKPTDTLSTDTLMQPVLKNKKTLKTVNTKDFKGVPNYILTHQEQDSCGEIQTKLVKGEILKTICGGTSVQFNEAEFLRKTVEDNQKPKTPKSEKKTMKKRKPVDDDAGNSEDSWTSVETRCAVGIEGKPGAEPNLIHHNKKLKP